MFMPGTIPGWKAPPVARIALIQPHECFKNIKNQIAQDAIFSFEKGIVPITIANTDDEVSTIHKNTTLRLSQLVSNRLTKEVNQKQTKYSDEFDPQYEWRKQRKKKKETNNNCRADCRNLTDDFSDSLSINQCDLVKCDATSHRIDVKPGSQPIKLPNRRKPVPYTDDLKENLDAFMTKELITSCHSPQSAPALFV